MCVVVIGACFPHRQEQTKLEERLRVLREEERQFVKDCETGVHLQQQAEEVRSFSRRGRG